LYEISIIYFSFQKFLLLEEHEFFPEKESSESGYALKLSNGNFSWKVFLLFSSTNWNLYCM